MTSVSSELDPSQWQSDKPRSLKQKAAKTLRRPTVKTGLSAVAIYAGLRLTIAAFHSLRRRNLRFLLFSVCNALHDLEITYWIDFGSLLGIHRDSDLIPYDNDIDLVGLDPDWTTLLPRLQERLHPKYSVKVVTPAKESSGSSWVRVYCPLGMADLFSAYSNSRNKKESVVNQSAQRPEENIVDSAVVLNGSAEEEHEGADSVAATAGSQDSESSGGLVALLNTTQLVLIRKKD